MGTLATFFRKTDLIPVAEPSAVRENGRPAAAKTTAVFQDGLAQYKLRALPNDDVYFFCKRIDNSRLVRQADPRTKGQCLSAIGAACVLAVLTCSVMAPKVASILTGYKVQELRHERSELMELRRSLDVEEATLLSPRRLDELAQKQKLDRPSAGQVVHLQPRGDTAFASVVVPAGLKNR
ncbi:MAG: hypothetical protein JWO80_5605 [Bryobacterales bacterium]|nr:hypothetical protein [Bryobacterales bacterium]